MCMVVDLFDQPSDIHDAGEEEASIMEIPGSPYAEMLAQQYPSAVQARDNNHIQTQTAEAEQESKQKQQKLASEAIKNMHSSIDPALFTK